MFSGIIQQIGRVESVESHDGDATLCIDVASLADELEPGESIAVNGVCLTVTSHEATNARFDVSAETLAVTTLGKLEAGATVNLERALRFNDLVGGHLVSGHVDTVGHVRHRETDARSTRFQIGVEPQWLRYIAEKGSVTVDGVSLTVNGIDERGFDVNIVPHTLEMTTFGPLAPGDDVNIEVDLVARYLERLANFSASEVN